MHEPELTDRQHEVMRFLVLGMSTAEIAHELTLSTPTVKQHLAGAYRALGVGRAAAAIAAYRELIDTPSAAAVDDQAPAGDADDPRIEGLPTIRLWRCEVHGLTQTRRVRSCPVSGCGKPLAGPEPVVLEAHLIPVLRRAVHVGRSIAHRETAASERRLQQLAEAQADAELPDPPTRRSS